MNVVFIAQLMLRNVNKTTPISKSVTDWRFLFNQFWQLFKQFDHYIVFSYGNYILFKAFCYGKRNSLVQTQLIFIQININKIKWAQCVPTRYKPNEEDKWWPRFTQVFHIFYIHFFAATLPNFHGIKEDWWPIVSSHTKKNKLASLSLP